MRRLGIALACIALTGVTTFVRPGVTTAASNAFYVNCASGSDGGSGAIDQPWRTLTRASAAPLAPGGQLLLARGCVWNGQRLDAAWNGLPDAPITITAYGAGARPVIRNGTNANVKVTGSYLVIDGLESGNDPRQVTACGQPVGQYYGFTFLNGAHDNTLTNSVSTGSTAGVHLAISSRATRVVGNVLTGNNVLQTFGTSTDIGAWGVSVHSNDNEIAFNQFISNAAVCTNGMTPHESNSLELFESSGNFVHDNVSLDDRVFTELGSSGAIKSANNIFADNIFATARPDSRFITTRGAGDTTFGPVLNTQVLDNTTFQTGGRSQGVVCDRGCAPGVLRLSGNILWAEEKAIYADAPFDLGANVVWNTTGNPFVQVPGSLAGITIANPGFADPAGNNFTPLSAPGFGATTSSGPEPSPLRILDTRPGFQQRGYSGAKPGPGSIVTLQVAGRAGIPQTGVAAVTMNVIITEAMGDGFVTVWPSGEPRPLASSLNVEGVGSTISNLVTVPIGADGKVKLFTQSGGHLVADVAGWLPANTFAGTVPTRVLDTRGGAQQRGYSGDKPANGATIDVQLGVAQGLPAQGASAVVLNVTATEADGSGFITAWPAGEPRPLASALNTVGGGTVSNQVTVAPGVDGKVSIFAQYGTHVVVDYAGYYKQGQGFVSAVPTRMLDTRPGPAQLEYSGGKPGIGQTLSLRALGSGPIPTSSVKAVILNVTATEASAPGFVSAWPGGEPRPLTSVLNVNSAGQTRSNAALVPVGADGTIQLFTQAGTHLVVDVTGWLTG